MLRGASRCPGARAKRRAARRRGAGAERRDGAALRGRSDLPQAAAQRLVSGPDHRALGRCAGPRLDRPSADRAGRGGRRIEPDAADRRMLQHRAAGSRVRSGRQSAAPLGRQRRSRLSMARQQPRTQHRQRRQHLDWRQRCDGRPRAEVHARRQVRDAGRQEGCHARQSFPGSFLPGREDVLPRTHERGLRG